MFKAIALAGVLMFSVTAAAETFFSWTARDGSESFTNELERVPSAYQDSVVERDSESFSEEKMTEGPPQDYAERLQARLDHLRKINAR